MSFLPFVTLEKPALALVALSALAQAQAPNQETLHLSAESFSRWVGVIATAGPDWEWNCLDTSIAETSLAAIMPNDKSGDPDRITEMLQLLQELVPDTVQSSTGQIGSYYAAGSLVAVEFDIFSANPVPDPGATLDVQGVIVGPNGEPVGTLHCFNAAQYALRQAFFVSYMGSPLASYELWLGNTLHSSAGGSRALRISGTDNTIFGSLKTNGTLRVEGSNQVVPDFLRYALGYVVTGSGHQLGTDETAAGASLPTPAQTASAYVAAATAAGTSFAGSVTIVSNGSGGFQTSGGAPIPDGSIVHATGDIYVGSDNLTGALTIISGGSIAFSASSCSLSAAVDGLLAWSASGSPSYDISVSGNNNTMRGASYSDGEFEVLGSNNQLTGRAAALVVTIAGADNQLNDGTRN